MQRRRKPLAPNAANAVANLARVRLELIAQREAAEEIRRLKQELEEMRPVVAELLDRRRY